MVDKKTKIARSLFLIILIIPVKNEPMATIAASSPGIASLRLPKKVSPPLSPKFINKNSSPRKIKKAIIKPTDHLPKLLWGVNLIVMFFY
jgi:hypothetical protein